MTREEKQDKLNGYCGSTGCEECKLNNGCWTHILSGRDCLNFDAADEAELDRALYLIAEREQVDDEVNHPSHYTDGKIEVIDFIEDKKLGFHLGNAVKYIARAGKKDPTKTVQDLKKARWYLDRKIEMLEAET